MRIFLFNSIEKGLFIFSTVPHSNQNKTQTYGPLNTIHGWMKSRILSLCKFDWKKKQKYQNLRNFAADAIVTKILNA